LSVLKRKCQLRNLSQSGRKSDLVERLNEFVSFARGDNESVQDDNDSGLDGFVFCMTGTMSISRAAMTNKIKSAGGDVKRSVTAAATHLLAADGEEGTSKYKKALDSGVSIIGEQELDDLIAGTGGSGGDADDDGGVHWSRGARQFAVGDRLIFGQVHLVLDAIARSDESDFCVAAKAGTWQCRKLRFAPDDDDEEIGGMQCGWICWHESTDVQKCLDAP
jgi:BRCA1 C Terminus (BRCT) domain/SAP domain